MGGWVPKPRYERAASARIAAAKARLACTTSGPRMFGSTWRSMMRKGPIPKALAASIYGCAFTESTLALATRAKAGTAASPIATIEVVTPGLKIAASNKAIRSAGRA